MIGQISEIVGLFLLSGVKFAIAPGLIIVNGYNYMECIIISISGGITGTIVFYYFGEYLVKRYTEWRNKKRKKEKVKKTFSRKNKLIVKTKVSYGLVGLALITPVFISIPVGSIVAARFFRNNKRTLPILCASVILWSFIITSLFSFGIIDPGE